MEYKNYIVSIYDKKSGAMIGKWHIDAYSEMDAIARVCTMYMYAFVDKSEEGIIFETVII